MRETDIIKRLIELIKAGKKQNAHVPFVNLLDLCTYLENDPEMLRYVAGHSAFVNQLLTDASKADTYHLSL